MATGRNGYGDIGATCAGCKHGPWPTGTKPDVVDAAVRACYGDTTIWLCGVTGARVEPGERACGVYDARNGELTQPFYPSGVFKKGSVKPADVGSVFLLLRAERTP